MCCHQASCKLGDTASRGNPKCFPQTKGKPVFIVNGPAMVPDWAISMQMRNPNLHSMIGPTTLIAWNLTSWLVVTSPSDWLVEMQISLLLCNSNSTGRVSAYWLKDDSRNSLIRVSLAAGAQSRRLAIQWAALIVNLSPINHKESFLPGVFLLRVNSWLFKARLWAHEKWRSL